LGKFSVSSGVNNSTTKGEYVIANKALKAWSSYGLWMPYWLGIKNTRFGIHELPIWPNGYREGSDHLGKPVSHGCVRLGIGSAKIIYDWAEIGTPVTIY
jgi:lipoprotein-anchoring transpeptidase ErfK/SrfK